MTNTGLAALPRLSQLRLVLARKIVEEVAKAPEAAKPAVRAAMVEKAKEAIAEKAAAPPVAPPTPPAAPPAPPAIPKGWIIAGAAGIGTLVLLGIALLARKRG